jgi:DNA-binding transcriptional ArsR family regulator
MRPFDRLKPYAQAFEALGVHGRLHIMEVLSHQERHGRDLAECLEFEQPHLSFHLKVLRNNHLIIARPAAPWKYHGTNPQKLDDLCAFLQSLKLGKRPLTCSLDCCQRL